MRKRSKLNKTWDYVLRSDDVRNKALWINNPESMKIYQLFVVEACSVKQVEDRIGIDEYYIYKLIEQIRSQYKIGFIGKLKRKFIMSTAGWRFRRMAKRNGIEL